MTVVDDSHDSVVVALLERLVAFDTTSTRPNRPLIDWVAEYLAGHGVKADVLPDATGEKASLIARIGPRVGDGIVLCGHTDVVPAEGQPWTRAPFTLSVDGNRLYGRGTADMKGFIACALAVVPEAVGAELRVPLILVFTHDEEIGCLAAPAVAKRLLDSVDRPALVITGEPTEMGVVRSHKGIRVSRTTITGRAAHSSRPSDGASAITAAARIVTFLAELAERQAATGLRVSSFDPPHTTVNVGTIVGGTALNIVPLSCSLLWEYRWVPGEDVNAISKSVEDFVATEVLPGLIGSAPEASVVTEVVADVPALDPAGNERAAQAVLSVGGTAGIGTVGFATDGAFFQAAGMPTVVCGPGSMAQGHRPDEYIEISELRRCTALLRRLIATASDA